jgi:hypothetical protein
MYSWTFSIKDDASNGIQSISQSIVNASGYAHDLNKRFKDMGSVSSQITPIADTINSIVESYDSGILDAAQKWDVFKNSASSALEIIKAGNYTDAIMPISTSINDAITVVGSLKDSWANMSSIIQSNETLGMVWDKFTVMGGIALDRAKSIGSTLLLETLPNVLTFVGQSVISMGGYVASLLGATTSQIALNAAMLANPVGVVVVGLVAVGAAVYTVINYWDDLKGYIVGFGEFLLKNSPFGWLYDIVNNVFPNFKNSVVNTFSSIWDDIYNRFIKPVSDAITWVKGQIASIWEGTVTPTISIENKPTIPNTSNAANDIATEREKTRGLSSTALSLGRQKRQDLSNIGKANSISGGEGVQIKNINQTINKLVEKIEIHTTGEKVDYRRVKDEVLQALMDASNDFNKF